MLRMQTIAEIKKVEQINESYFILWFESALQASKTKAGQFFEITPVDKQSSILRAPISVYDVNQDRIGLMIKNVGSKTATLSTLQPGDLIDVIGPLGKGFPIVEHKRILLVSGGIGYPALYYLKKQLRNCQITWLHGGQTQLDTFPCDIVYTDNGSVGIKGLVTEGVIASIGQDSYDVIYSCGPHGMLRELHSIANSYNILLYVSLESYMACGVGVCHGCAVALRDTSDAGWHYGTVCKDGPVFDSREVVWDE